MAVLSKELFLDSDWLPTGVLYIIGKSVLTLAAIVLECLCINGDWKLSILDWLLLFVFFLLVDLLLAPPPAAFRICNSSSRHDKDADGRSPVELVRMAVFSGMSKVRVLLLFPVVALVGLDCLSAVILDGPGTGSVFSCSEAMLFCLFTVVFFGGIFESVSYVISM